MSEGRRNPRQLTFVMDVVHLLIGAAVVILSVLAFLSPEEHRLFFPVIFFLAALLCLINGVMRLRTAGRDSGKKRRGAGELLTGILLCAIGAVSAVVML